MSLDPTGPMTLYPGFEVCGHRIIRPLGEGGFGAVFEAEDLALQRRVALKVLHDPDGHVLARFQDEARLLARLSSPHITTIYRIDRLPGGQPFLTMELFGDGALHKHLPRGRPAPLRFAVDVLAQMLEALAAAHDEGVIHRDIKEANVLVDRERGLVKVCDFGIARAVEPMDGEAPPTANNAVLGTPHYIAPERFRGVHDDPRSDLYSAGVVFYRMLTGRRPFETPGANPLAVAHRVVTEDAPEPEAVPAAIARICGRLLARDLTLRYPTAHAALTDLRRATETALTSATPAAIALDASLSMPAPAMASNRRLAIIGVGAAAAAAGLFMALSRSADPGTSAQTPVADARPVVAPVDAQPPVDAARPDAAVDAKVVDAVVVDAAVPDAAPPKRPRPVRRPSTKRPPKAPATQAPASKPPARPSTRPSRTPTRPSRRPTRDHSRDPFVVPGAN